MKKEFRRDIRAMILGSLVVALALGAIAFCLWLARRPSPLPERLILVPEDGLVRGEVYFYGPADADMLERYGASDETRKLVLLDGRPGEAGTTDTNDYFQGGDLYRMAHYLNRDFEKISALPENSNVVLQYHFYYEDGSFVPVYVYPHAISANGAFYTLDAGEEDSAMSRANFVVLLEQLFWTLSVGIWP